MITKHGRRIDIRKLPTAVYRLFDEGDTLLYVGTSYDPDARVARHRKKSWGPQIATIKAIWYPNRPTALHVEAAAIRDERPRHNHSWVSPESYVPSTPIVGLDEEQMEDRMLAAIDRFMSGINRIHPADPTTD